MKTVTTKYPMQIIWKKTWNAVILILPNVKAICLMVIHKLITHETFLYL